jgi:ribosomal protein L35
MKSHNLEKKSSKRKHAFRKDQPLSEANVRTIRKMFGRKAVK